MDKSTAFLNHDIYLNHLSPDKVAPFEIARNSYLAILGIVIWDVLIYIPDDIQIMFKRFSTVNLCFIISRVFTIVYAFIFVIMQTRPVEDCRAMSIAMHIFCVLSMACASFLFLRRLHAVYTHNRIIRWIFTFLWIGMTACGIPTLVGFHMEHIPGTGYCTPSKIEEYVSIIDFFPAAFDTLVFFAISYRLFIIHGTAGGRVGWRDFVMGKSLSGLLRVLLHGGQQYYLVVFGVAIVSGAIIYAPPSISNTYGLVVALASTTLTASMACRVFRNLKTLNQVADQSSLLPVISPIQFTQPSLSKDLKDSVAGKLSHES